MRVFYTVAKLIVDDAENFFTWYLNEFSWKDEKTKDGYTGETVMMALAAGFYSNLALGKDQVKLVYVLKKEDLQKALMILGKALEEYNNQ